MTSRGALASSRVMLFNRFTRRSGRGVTTGLGPSLWRQKTCQHTNEPKTFQVPQHFVNCWRSYLTLRTLQALHFPVRWLRTTENSTSSPVWSSRPSCTSFTWKNSFLLSPTSYVIKPNWEQIQNKNKFKKKKPLELLPCNFLHDQYALFHMSQSALMKTDRSLPGLWHTPPRLGAVGPRCKPSSAQFGQLCKPGTWQVLLSADSPPCLPYPWFRRGNCGF